MNTASHEVADELQVAPAHVVQNPVRCTVVGAGWISQTVLLPGVTQSGNPVVTALATDNGAKTTALADRYGTRCTHGYADYNQLLTSGNIGAIYLALPNDMHRQYALSALQRGVHVLLEEPMATSEADYEATIEAVRADNVKLIIAYRLHFGSATLAAIELVRTGKLDRIHASSAMLSQSVAPSSHRASHGYWVGPVSDMDIYPINAMHNLFGEGPIEVSVCGVRDPDLPFNFDDTVSVTLRSADHRITQFVVSYSGTSIDRYRIPGTKGDLEVSLGFMFGAGLEYRATIDGKAYKQVFDMTDQFGGKLRYSSDCIPNNREPEPDGEEGLANARVLVVTERVLEPRQPQDLGPLQRQGRMETGQMRKLPPVPSPELVDAAEPGKG